MLRTRRELLRRSLPLFAGLAAGLKVSPAELSDQLARAMEARVLKTELFPSPVRISSVELLRVGSHSLVRVRAADGTTGYSAAQGPVMSVTYPIFVHRVAPGFVGKDARELESLLSDVYLANSNYKWQGLAFWVSVAAIEIAILDLLGKVVGKPLGELLGKVVRREIKVYRASEKRGNSPEAEIEYLQKLVSETGAEAIKFRLGGRMRYHDASTKRDLSLIPLTRKVFGEAMTIYADANGSYDVPMALRIGRLMEEQKFGFFEEPVPFDYYDETRQIAKALKIPIALGEQEMSLRGFRRIIETGTARVIQPDLLYFGGIIRSLKVARMAQAAGLDCTAHMSGGGLGYLYVAHFASCVPNAGPHQEYKGEEEGLPVMSDSSSLKSVKGVLKVPTGPGLGITLDPDFLKKATPVTA
ncbi:MAG: mandelate racemase/muconate lactonizing enzyme family protein [Bryobacteraceae bacterium]|nr:mandelate racemase/muconate lactonizing enzyme family protein [Bryobacteraceae bacterium]